LPFQIAMQARPWSVMSAYQKINGLHVSEDPLLLLYKLPTSPYRWPWHLKVQSGIDCFGCAVRPPPVDRTNSSRTRTSEVEGGDTPDSRALTRKVAADSIVRHSTASISCLPLHIDGPGISRSNPALIASDVLYIPLELGPVKSKEETPRTVVLSLARWRLTPSSS
jgi:hypothetical protein